MITNISQKRSFKLFFLIVFCALFFYSSVFAQTNPCPVNIDFEFGSFNNWQAYTGTTSVSSGKNIVNVSPATATPGVIDMIQKGTQVDPYGLFPVSAPDGSKYSVKLGNSGTGARADRLSYDFLVPNSQTDFVITYQYAVVLEDPGHSPAEQPRFTAKVFDVTDNAYLSCGSFEYIATSSLPGFKHASSGSVIYKDWTPVSINLNGFQGHKLRLEFTSADCTVSGHFGYAYIDVNGSCSELIKGVDFCPAESTIRLTGPAGFDKYQWYSADRSKVLGTSQILTLPTAGMDGVKVQLDLTPFVGFGCNYSITATLKALPGFVFKTTSPPAVCAPAAIDLTSQQITKASDANLVYSYWKDAAATIALPAPNAIAISDTYYIKATAPSGCTDIQSVNVVVNPLPTLLISDPKTVCLASPVNLTAPAITPGSTAGLTYTYWQNAAATELLATPFAVTVAGTYYVMATANTGCFVIKPVKITYFPLPNLVITNPAPVCYPAKVNITLLAVIAGSDANLIYTYWANQEATIPLAAAAEISESGIYYIKAINNNGCEKVAAVTVTNYPLPELKINTPQQVCFPDKVNLTAATVTAGSNNIANLTYWADANATTALTSPQAVADSGLYYVKATSVNGCEVIKPVLVIIHKLPVVMVTDPGKVYLPNNIDLTQQAITAGSSPNLQLTYFNDSNAFNEVGNPKAVDKTGTYYIKGTNIYGCYTITPVEVTVATVPQIMVPKAFTPTQLTNNKLYPFLLGVKTLSFFKVFDRWGSLVYQTTDPDPTSGWNGVYKGQIHYMDTYTWYAEGYDYVGKLVHKSGNTLLLK